MNEMNITKKMLATLRQGRVDEARKAAQVFVKEDVEADNFLTRSKILMEEAVDKKKTLNEEETIDDKHKKTFEIKKDTPQFGDVRTTQEEAIRKTINDNVQFKPNALKYYPNADDMTLDGSLPQMGIKFQFRYSEPSGDGCFIFCDGFQLTDTNTRLVGKIRDSFMNWKNSITQDGDLMEKLKKAANDE